MLGSSRRPTSIAVLTSGGDAAGMNAAVRAVVRTGIRAGLTVYAVYEGFQGLVDGGDYIRRITSDEVGGILHRGGTVLGTARCQEFRERDGRRRAARNLAELGIEALAVIGGDGSLTGANQLCTEWPELLDELADRGELDREIAEARRRLILVGMVGSIDNDMAGTDMTIGADTALHRITEAIDAIQSTASSHQRSFVIEVMGRNCGYLALMGGIATGANFVFLPESPPEDGWPDTMADALKAGRAIGRRSNIVIVAEGARDRHGEPITAHQIRDILEEKLGEDTRVTSLGHVQRGGSPSAFDRYLSTVLGYAAVEKILSSPDAEPQLIGIRGHQIISSPLMANVETTRSVARVIAEHDYERAMEIRGGNFRSSLDLIKMMVQAQPHETAPEERRLRLAIMHAGGPAPGMNTAVRVAVRVGLDMGHTMLGVRDGFRGLVDGNFMMFEWMTVSSWVSSGGAELGSSRFLPDDSDFDAIEQHITEQELDGILMIGGFTGYSGAYLLRQAAATRPALSIPIVCVPASINNDLPGSELSIGADTALNSIVRDVDKIKQSAVASQRTFVVEVMGKDSGYLALMSGLATGAERVYLPEEGITLRDLQVDVEALSAGFAGGKRLGLVIRSEHADDTYTTSFIKALFEREGGDLFDVREAVLGHVQQGGSPSPFDRIQATRLASSSIRQLIDVANRNEPTGLMAGLRHGKVHFVALNDLPQLMEPHARRPRRQDWLDLRPLAAVMAGRNVPAAN